MKEVDSENDNRIKLNIDYVSDIIGDEYKDWKPGDVVIIDAQTGTGKNFFIEEKLISWVSPEKILYVSNRTNLKREVKIRLLEEYGKEVPMTPEGELDLKKLDSIKTIDNITIASYHALQHSSINQLYKGKLFDLSRYSAIILDECQFPMTDSGFNNLCYLTYDKLFTKQHSDIIKVFMSGTMEDVKDDIVNSAKEAGKTVHIYETNRDYSYVNVKYLKHYGYVQSLVNMIKNDVSKEKWLIFITDLDQGKEILKELGEDKCSIIKSGTKSDELDSILYENQFEKKVLIATKALDNGINLKDDLLTNIVILSWDKTSLIQMLGRKRIDIEKAQPINLYISARSKGAFSQLKRKYNARQKDIDLFYQDEDKNSFNKKYDHGLSRICDDLFYKDSETNEFMINPIGEARHKKDMEFAESMIAAFEIDKDFAYVHQQLNWLGLKDTFDEEKFIESDDIILNSEIETLKEYIDGISGEKLFQEEQEQLSHMIIKELTTIGNDVDYRTKILKPSTIENLLRDELGLEYSVSKPKQERSKKSEHLNQRYIIITKI